MSWERASRARLGCVAFTIRKQGTKLAAAAGQANSPTPPCHQTPRPALAAPSRRPHRSSRFRRAHHSPSQQHRWTRRRHLSRRRYRHHGGRKWRDRAGPAPPSSSCVRPQARGTFRRSARLRERHGDSEVRAEYQWGDRGCSFILLPFDADKQLTTRTGA